MPPLTKAEKAAIEEEKRRSDARIAKRLAMKKKKAVKKKSVKKKAVTQPSVNRTPVKKKVVKKKKAVNISRKPPKPSAQGRKNRMDAYLDSLNKKR
jgi:hypothetical protein